MDCRVGCQHGVHSDAEPNEGTNTDTYATNRDADASADSDADASADSDANSSTDSCAVMSGGFSKEPALLAPLERRERERRRELRDKLPLCLRTELSSSGTKSPAAVAGRRRWGL